MELRHLRTFLVAAETLNISAAARQLGVTQPALSRQIRELEREVGHSLFVRHPGGLRLTATGEVLRERGGRALVEMDAALREARGEGAREPAVLRVGYYGTMVIWSRILAPAFEKLGRSHPGLTYSLVELTNTQMVAGLREGRLDVALLGPGDTPSLPGVAWETACDLPATVLAPVDHPLAKKRRLALTDLRDHEIVALTPESAPGRDQALLAACRAEGFTPRILNVGSTLLEALSIGVQRKAVGVVGHLGRGAPYPGVVYIPLKPPGVTMRLHVAHVAQSTAARALAELIGVEARRAVTSVR